MQELADAERFRDDAASDDTAPGNATPGGSNTTFRILLYDEERARRDEALAAIRLRLSDKVQCIEAHTATAATRILAEGRFNCVVLASEIPGAVESVLSCIVASSAAKNPRAKLRDPVVVIGGRNSRALEQRWMSLGAQEFVATHGVPGLLPIFLPSAVHRAVIRHELASLRQSSSSFRLLGEQLEQVATGNQIGIWDWDIPNSTVSISDHYRKLYGMSMAEDVSYERWINEFVHPDDRAEVERAGERLFERGEEYEIEFRTRHRELGVRWMSAHGRLFRNAQGEPVRFIGANVDITERKPTLDAVSSVVRRKSDILALVAHELRNPIAPLHAAAELCRQAPDDVNLVVRCAGVIGRQVGLLQDMLDDLLDVAQMSNDKLALDKRALRLGEVVQLAMEVTESSVSRRGHELILIGPFHETIIHGDRARLTQIFVNLINNAVKFSEAGSRIWVTLMTLEETGILPDEVRIQIRDEGLGVDSSMLDRIFEPFVQIKSDRSTATGGLGIGLALVKQLVESHGGHVFAERNSPLPGLTFTFTLARGDEFS